jgi:ubiquinone/menaquinone biosynthesis C-methylase UbiE
MHDVERFNRWAPHYEHHFLQRLVFEPVQRMLLEVAVAERADAGAILDVGCGTGRLLRATRALFPNARLEGVDPAAEMVKQAQAESQSGITFRQAFAEDLPFGDREFDLVFSTMTLHHWADQARGIREVARVMTADGRWLLADFVPRGLFRLIRSRRFPRRVELHSKLSEVGLRIQSQRLVARLGGQVSIFVIRQLST